MTVDKRQDRNFGTLIIVVLGVVVVLWLASIGVVGYFFEDWAGRGQFGDMFGAVNSLFSGLALAGVVIAILLQRSELQLQREELKLTRDELRRTAEAQEASQAAMAEHAQTALLAARINAHATLLQSADTQMASGRFSVISVQAASQERHLHLTELTRILVELRADEQTGAEE